MLSVRQPIDRKTRNWQSGSFWEENGHGLADVPVTWLGGLPNAVQAAAVGMAWSLLSIHGKSQAVLYLLQKQLLCWKYIPDIMLTNVSKVIPLLPARLFTPALTKAKCSHR